MSRDAVSLALGHESCRMLRLKCPTMSSLSFGRFRAYDSAGGIKAPAALKLKY